MNKYTLSQVRDFLENYIWLVDNADYSDANEIIGDLYHDVGRLVSGEGIIDSPHDTGLDSQLIGIALKSDESSN